MLRSIIYVTGFVFVLLVYGWLYNPIDSSQNNKANPEAQRVLDIKRKYLKKDLRLSRITLRQPGPNQSFSFNITVYNTGNKDVKDIHIVCHMFRSYGTEMGTVETTLYLDFKANSQRQIDDLKTFQRRDLSAVDCEIADALVVNN